MSNVSFAVPEVRAWTVDILSRSGSSTTQSSPLIVTLITTGTISLATILLARLVGD